MNSTSKYIIKIGLEIHAQLKTKTKLFSSDPVAEQEKANSQLTSYTAGCPGTLPVLNKKAVELALKCGHAFNCEIQKISIFERKNYFYPDLPKGYQITQNKNPIGRKGKVTFFDSKGELKTIYLEQIHLEEDAGKTIYSNDKTFIDLNRAGTPLIEIVTQPEITTAQEAKSVILEIRKTLRYIDASDANMEKGQLRCDVNVSVHPKNEFSLSNSKVEIKNLNSLRSIEKAINFEVDQQISSFEKGKKIQSQTKGFNEKTGETYPLRNKKDKIDYRFITDPDLPPLLIEDPFIKITKENLKLPALFYESFLSFNIHAENIKIISEEKSTAELFLQVLEKDSNPKTTTKVFVQILIPSAQNRQKDISKLHPEQTAFVINQIDKQTIDFFNAKETIIPIIYENPNIDLTILGKTIEKLNYTDPEGLNELITKVVEQYPEKVGAYKNGQTGLLGFFMGQVLQNTKKSLNRKNLNKMLKAKLDIWQEE